MIASRGGWLVCGALLVLAPIAQAQIPDPEFAKMARRAAARDSVAGYDDLTVSPAPAPTPQSLVQPYGTWRMQPPPVLFGASMVLDPVHQRLVAACGSNGYLQKNVWTLSLVPGSTWQLDSLASAQSPGALAYASTIYDPVHARMVMFGGLDYPAAPSNQVWTLSLGDPMVWSAVPTQGVPPSPRYNAVGAYDSRRNRLIVYGGEDGAGPKSDAWALDLGDTARWEQLEPADSIPAPRTEAVGVYDPLSDRLLVFGGLVITPDHYHDVSTDLWQLSLGDTVAWQRIDTPGRYLPRSISSAAVYDPNGRRMFLFGGEGNWDTPWMLDLSDAPIWSVVRPYEPQHRERFTAVYDASSQRILIAGGSESGLDESDVEVLSLSGDPKWSTLGLHPRAPGRARALTMFDSRRDRMIIYGGTVENGHDDTWAMSLGNLGSWTRLSSSKTPEFYLGQPAAAYDSQGDRCFLLGGVGNYRDGVQSNLLVLTLADTSAVWTEVATTGDPPPARRGAAMIYDPVRNRLLVFGGRGVDFQTYRDVFYDDVWALSLTGSPRWTRLNILGSTCGSREQAWAFYDPVHDSMVIHGGLMGPPDPPFHGPVSYHIWHPRYSNDQEEEWWSLSLQGQPAWRQLQPQGSGPSLDGESIAYDSAHKRFLVEGGRTRAFFGQYNISTWGLNLEPELRWEYLLTSGDPATGREMASSVYDPVADRLVVFGGYGLITRKNDVWALEFSNGAAPPAWIVRSSIERGNVKLVWGCRDGAGTSATLYGKTESTSWSALTSGQSDGAGELTFTDRPSPDHWRETYRIGVTQNGVTTYSAPVDVQLQETRQPLLVGAYPNPSRVGDFQVRFQLPSPASARLEMIDVRGRVVFAQNVIASTPGIETVQLPTQSRSGVYLLRLLQNGKAATLKAVVLE